MFCSPSFSDAFAYGKRWTNINFKNILFHSFLIVILYMLNIENGENKRKQVKMFPSLKYSHCQSLVF